MHNAYLAIDLPEDAAELVRDLVVDPGTTRGGSIATWTERPSRTCWSSA